MKIITSSIWLALSLAAQAATYLIDFSTEDALSGDLVTGPLIFNNVFTGSANQVDAIVTTTSAYTTNNVGNNGANGNDLRVSLARGTDVDLNILFVEAGTTNAITNAYLGTVSFGYTLVAFDIDGAGTSGLEQVSSSNTDFVTIAETSNLTPIFNGATADGSNNNYSPTSERTWAEFSYFDEANPEFNFAIIGGTGSNRNFQIDGTDLEFTVDTTNTPEPSSATLLGLGGLALLARRRR